MKRQRGRGRKPGGGGGGGGGNQQPQPRQPIAREQRPGCEDPWHGRADLREVRAVRARRPVGRRPREVRDVSPARGALLPRDGRDDAARASSAAAEWRGRLPAGPADGRGPAAAAIEGGMQGGGQHGGAHSDTQGGEHGSDAMRSWTTSRPTATMATMTATPLKSASSSQAISADRFGEQSSAAASGDGDEAEASGEDGEQGQGDADGGGRGRRRRGRRRPQDGDRPNAAGGGGAGGDTEARSALDSLARKQGALAGG